VYARVCVHFGLDSACECNAAMKVNEAHIRAALAKSFWGGTQVRCTRDQWWSLLVWGVLLCGRSPTGLERGACSIDAMHHWQGRGCCPFIRAHMPHCQKNPPSSPSGAALIAEAVGRQAQPTPDSEAEGLPLRRGSLTLWLCFSPETAAFASAYPHTHPPSTTGCKTIALASRCCSYSRCYSRGAWAHSGEHTATHSSATFAHSSLTCTGPALLTPCMPRLTDPSPHVPCLPGCTHLTAAAPAPAPAFTPAHPAAAPLSHPPQPVPPAWPRTPWS